MNRKVISAFLVSGWVLAGCAKSEEVVPPQSTLETSLQPTVMATQKPWPTSGVVPTTVLTPGVTETPAATTAAMQTQPQTGIDPNVLLMVLAMVGGGAAMIVWGRPGQVKGKGHGQRK